jgi:hypothetical protein
MFAVYASAGNVRLFKHPLKPRRRALVAFLVASVPLLILLITKSNAPLLSAVPAIWLCSIPLYHVELINAGDLL